MGGFGEKLHHRHQQFIKPKYFEIFSFWVLVAYSSMWSALFSSNRKALLLPCSYLHGKQMYYWKYLLMNTMLQRNVWGMESLAQCCKQENKHFGDFQRTRVLATTKQWMITYALVSRYCWDTYFNLWHRRLHINEQSFILPIYYWIFLSHGVVETWTLYRQHKSTPHTGYRLCRWRVSVTNCEAQRLNVEQT